MTALHPALAHLNKIAAAKSGAIVQVAEPITVRRFAHPDTYTFPAGAQLQLNGNANATWLIALAPLEGGNVVSVFVPSDLYGSLDVLEPAHDPR